MTALTGSPLDRLQRQDDLVFVLANVAAAGHHREGCVDEEPDFASGLRSARFTNGHAGQRPTPTTNHRLRRSESRSFDSIGRSIVPGSGSAVGRGTSVPVGCLA